MLICTGLGNNYPNLVTTAIYIIGTADPKPDKLIPMKKYDKTLVSGDKKKD